jgi:hypothetical protein
MRQQRWLRPCHPTEGYSLLSAAFVLLLPVLSELLRFLAAGVLVSHWCLALIYCCCSETGQWEVAAKFHAHQIGLNAVSWAPPTYLNSSILSAPTSAVSNFVPLSSAPPIRFVMSSPERVRTILTHLGLTERRSAAHAEAFGNCGQRQSYQGEFFLFGSSALLCCLFVALICFV